MNRWLWRLVASAAFLSACTSSTSSTDPLKSGVQVSFSTRSVTMPAPPAFAFTSLLGDTLRDGTNVLVIDKAQLVIRKLELERAISGECAGGSECEEVVAGPVLVDLPLVPGAQTKFTVDAPAGTYNRIVFELHKVTDSDPAEDAFRQAHPDLGRNSVLVQGRFNGQAFTFLNDVNAQQQLNISPPLLVNAGSPAVNVTIKVDISTWFRSSGGGLFDPATANKGGPNENRVSGNIRESMRAFEDRDRNGDDHDG